MTDPQADGPARTGAGPSHALQVAYSGISDVAAGLDDHHLLLPSGCHGWSVADLMFHLTLDAQRALVTLFSPADGPPDRDHVSYWRARGGPPDATGSSPDASGSLETGSSDAHARWVRRSAAAFDRPRGVLQPWLDTAPAAARAVAAADPEAWVATQGHVLTVRDFVATLVTEAVIHHLDLIAALPGADGPAPPAVAVALSTLTGLAGPDGLPPTWSDRETLLKGTGRRPLTDADRAALTVPFPLLR